MTTTGPIYASSGNNQTGIGTQAWTIGDLTADNNNYTTADLDGSEISNYLRVAFDFSAIGDSDTIDAIFVEILRFGESSNRIGDNLIQWMIAGSLDGNNKALVANWSNTETWQGYGDTTSDAWGLTITGADLKNASTYLVIVAQNESGSNWDAFIDSVRVTVVHTASGVNINANAVTLELAPQAATFDVPVNVNVNPVTLELAPQSPTFDVGGVNILANTVTLELVPQSPTIDLGSPGVNVEAQAVTLELVTGTPTIQAPGAALLIGAPTPLPISVDSLDLIDHVAGTISHSIVASSNPGANEILLKSTPNGYLRLERLGVGKDPVQPLDIEGNIQLTGSLLHTGDLTILASGGDVLLEDTHIQAHNWVSGTTGWGIQHDGDADFRNITADSLTVEAFIADINLALAGSQIISKSVAIVSRPFTIPAVSGTLFVYDLPGFENTQVFADGDYVRLRYIDRSGGGLVVGDAWGTVSSYTDLGGGEQSWTWTYVSGSIGQIITEGATALDYGQSGDGYWHVTTLDPLGSPYAEIGTWVTDPSVGGNHSVHVRMGQLDGIAGVGDEWGLWAGQASNIYLLLSDTNFAAHGLRLSLYESGGTETLRLNPSVPSLAIGNTLPTGMDSGGNGLWVGLDGASYKLRLGNPTGTALRWDGTTLRIRNSSNADVIVIDNAGASYFAGVMTLGASGGIWQGTGSFGTPTTGLKIWRDSSIGRIAGYNSGTLQWYAGTDGKLYAGAGAVVLDADGITLPNHTAQTYEGIKSLKFKSGATTFARHWLYTSALVDRSQYIIEAISPNGSQKVSLTLYAGNGSAEETMESSSLFRAERLRSNTGWSSDAPGDVSYSGNLNYYVGSTKYTVYGYRPISKATSTNFNGDNFGPTNDQTIDLSASFGLPAGIKAVNVTLVISSNSGTTSDEVWLGPSSSPSDNQLSCRAMNGVNQQYVSGIVNCDSNGDVYLTILNAATTVRVWIEIWGYYI